MRPTPHVRFRDGTMDLAQSDAALARARRVIPGQTHTLGKRIGFFAPGSFPAYLERGSGAHVWDVDGNCYLDFVASLGAASLGFDPPAVATAVRAQLERGMLLSMPTLLEVEAVEAVSRLVPGAERVRFLKTGADACSAAVRLARLVTGRPRLASCGYHGWHEQFDPTTPGALGALGPWFLPFDVLQEEGPASLETVLEHHGREVAAVVLSLPYNPVLSSAGLRRVRELCDRHGALLILDEVVTGFRLALGGAQEHHGVRADLTCLAKALGAGMPISAVAGPAAVMERFGEMHVSVTSAGETLSLAAVVAALREYETTDYVARIHRLGERFLAGVAECSAEVGVPPCVAGYAPLPTFRFAPGDAEHQRIAERFMGLCAQRGVLFRRGLNFVTGAHREEDIDLAVEVVRAALRDMANEGAL